MKCFPRTRYLSPSWARMDERPDALWRRQDLLRRYTLPDGSTVWLGDEASACIEPLFDPTFKLPDATGQEDVHAHGPGLADLLQEAVMAVHPSDTWKHQLLWKHVFVTGTCTSICAPSSSVRQPNLTYSCFSGGGCKFDGTCVRDCGTLQHAQHECFCPPSSGFEARLQHECDRVLVCTESDTKPEHRVPFARIRSNSSPSSITA